MAVGARGAGVPPGGVLGDVASERVGLEVRADDAVVEAALPCHTRTAGSRARARLVTTDLYWRMIVETVPGTEFANRLVLG